MTSGAAGVLAVLATLIKRGIDAVCTARNALPLLREDKGNLLRLFSR
jgi:hypothetical protein